MSNARGSFEAGRACRQAGMGRVEVLVVLAGILFICMIMLPASGHARQRSKAMVCMVNGRILSQA